MVKVKLGQVPKQIKGGSEDGNEANQQSQQVEQEPFEACSQREAIGIRASAEGRMHGR